MTPQVATADEKMTARPSVMMPKSNRKKALATVQVYLPLPAASMQVKTFTRWAKGFDRWLARTQRLPLPSKTEGSEDLSLRPKRGGVSVELVGIVWELG